MQHMQARIVLLCHCHGPFGRFITSLNATNIGMLFNWHIIAIFSHHRLLITAYNILIFRVYRYQRRHFAKNAIQCLIVIDKHVSGRCTEKQFHPRHLCVVTCKQSVDIVVSSPYVERIIGQ